MSTILDALRKVQNERRPRDLQESVARSERPGRRARRWPRLLFLLLVLGSLGAGGFWLWQSPQRAELLALVDLADDEEAGAPDDRAPAAREQPERVTARRKAIARNLDRASADRRSSPAAAPAPTRGSARPPDPEAAATTVPRDRAEAAARRNAPEGPQSAQASDPAGGVSTRAQRPRIRRRAPVPVVPKPERTQERAAEPAADDPVIAQRAPVPRPEIDLSMRLEPVPRQRRDDEAVEIFMTGTSSLAFPELLVERVSWHPAPERRSARISLDGTRPIDAREGDIIAGVEIERIDPGAIEVRMGDTLRRIQLGQ